MKAKPFGPVQCLELQQNTEILTKDNYDSSTYSMSSGRSLLHSASVKLLVEDFLNSHLTGKMDQSELKKLSHKISKYATQIVDHFDAEQSENILLCSVENFKMLLPKETFQYFSINEITILFENIFKTIYLKDDMDQHVLINSILQNTIHSLEKKTKSTNYTECILYELMKELIISMNIEDIPHILDHITNALSNLSNFKPHSINIARLANHLLEHANINFIEELNIQILTDLIQHIVCELTQKK